MLSGSVFLVRRRDRGASTLVAASRPHCDAWLAWAYLVTFGSVVAFTAYVWVLSAWRRSRWSRPTPTSTRSSPFPRLADPVRGDHAGHRDRRSRRGRAVAIVVSSERKPRRRCPLEPRAGAAPGAGDASTPSRPRTDLAGSTRRRVPGASAAVAALRCERSGELRLGSFATAQHDQHVEIGELRVGAMVGTLEHALEDEQHADRSAPRGSARGRRRSPHRQSCRMCRIT